MEEKPRKERANIKELFAQLQEGLSAKEGSIWMYLSGPGTLAGHLLKIFALGGLLITVVLSLLYFIVQFLVVPLLPSLCVACFVIPLWAWPTYARDWPFFAKRLHWRMVFCSAMTVSSLTLGLLLSAVGFSSDIASIALIGSVLDDYTRSSYLINSPVAVMTATLWLVAALAELLSSVRELIETVDSQAVDRDYLLLASVAPGNQDLERRVEEIMNPFYSSPM
jgi:hypothetical protein